MAISCGAGGLRFANSGGMAHFKNAVTAWIGIGLALFALVSPGNLRAEPAKLTERQRKYLANLHELEVLRTQLRNLAPTSPNQEPLKQKIASLESYQRSIRMLIDYYGDEVVGRATEPSLPADSGSSVRAVVPVTMPAEGPRSQATGNSAHPIPPAATAADPDFDQEKFRNLKGERSAAYLQMKLHETRMEKEIAELRALSEKKRPVDFAKILRDKEAARRRVKQKIAAFETDYDLRRGTHATAQDHARSAFHSIEEIDRQIQQLYGQIRPIDRLSTLENNLKIANEIRTRIMARHLLKPYPLEPDNELAHRLDHAEWTARFGFARGSADDYIRRTPAAAETHPADYWGGKLESFYQKAGIRDPEILKNARAIDRERSTGRFAMRIGSKLSPRNCILGVLALSAAEPTIHAAVASGGMAILNWISGTSPTFAEQHPDQARALYEERLLHPCSRTEANICEKIEDLEVFCYQVKKAYQEKCVAR